MDFTLQKLVFVDVFYKFELFLQEIISKGHMSNALLGWPLLCMQGGLICKEFMVLNITLSYFGLHFTNKYSKLNQEKVKLVL